MQIVINIPKEIYEASQILEVKYKDTVQIPLEVIANGTPLPKGHGDLKDVSKFIYDCDYGVCDKICRCDNCVHRIVREKVIKDAPTIIEADKEIDK